MAKGDKFYFENFVACAELSKQAALYLVNCLENYDPKSIEKMLEEMHTIEHSADMKKLRQMLRQKLLLRLLNRLKNKQLLKNKI